MRRIAEFKRAYADTLKDLMSEVENDAFVNNVVVNVLTNLDQDGRRMPIIHCGKIWDTKKVTAEQLFRIFYLIHIAALIEENTQVHGVVVIMDFDGLGMSQIASLTPAWSKRLLTFIQHAMPIRLKQVHIVNQPFMFNVVWKLFKPFVREKLSKRVRTYINETINSFGQNKSVFLYFASFDQMFFHGMDRKSLLKHIKSSHLPTNYGGDLPQIDYSGKDWVPSIKDHIDFITKWNTYGFASSNQ